MGRVLKIQETIGKGDGANPFYFCLLLQPEHAVLVVLDDKGNPFIPDYRQYPGIVRLALREYVTQFQQGMGQKGDSLWDNTVVFSYSDKKDPQGSQGIIDPSPALLDLVISTGLLVDASFSPLKKAEGTYRLFLQLVKETDEKVAFHIGLQNLDDGSVLIVPKEAVQNRQFFPVHRERIFWNELLYQVEDLGPLWKQVPAIEGTCKEQDLAIHLSLVVSNFPNLGIQYEGFTLYQDEQRITQGALLFKEVDPYGYLHLRPVYYLEGYPPGFLEEQNIIRLAEIDKDFKTIKIADVLYGPSPVQSFKNLLYKQGKSIEKGVFQEESYFILTPEVAEDLIGNHFMELMNHFVLLQSEVLRRYRVRLSRPLLKMRLSWGIDFLGGEARIEIEGKDFSFHEFVHSYVKEGYIKLADNTRLYVLPREIDRLRRLVSVNARETEKVEISFFNYPALMALPNIQAEGDGWEKAREFYMGLNHLAEKEESYPLAEGSLRPYQNYGVRWLAYVTSHRLGACLADDMGLGKTVQVLALLRKHYQKAGHQPSLILMPRSLLYNWEAELKRFAPELCYRIFHGSQRDKEDLQDPALQVVLSTYATARIDQELFQAIRWEYIILDESQNIKNMENKTSRAILSFSSQYRIAMSGTPIENNLGELYSLFAFLNPSLFGSWSDFVHTYLQPIQENKDTEVARELRLKIYPFILRRLKEDVLLELPKKTEQTMLIELDPQHLKLYQTIEAEQREAVNECFERGDAVRGLFLLLRAMTVLRRLAGIPEEESAYPGISAKREYLLDMIENLAAEGHKCLVFTNFLAAVETLSEDLSRRDLAHLVMTGATVDRQALVHRFQTDPSIKAFIMTLKTGGVGLNLTAADYVFIFDPWWNRSAETQAIDRVYRIGQTKPVFSYRLIAKDTIEERILQLQQQKVDLVNTILNSDGDLVKSLTPEDIQFLLGGKRKDTGVAVL